MFGNCMPHKSSENYHMGLNFGALQSWDSEFSNALRIKVISTFLDDIFWFEIYYFSENVQNMQPKWACFQITFFQTETEKRRRFCQTPSHHKTEFVIQTLFREILKAQILLFCINKMGYGVSEQFGIVNFLWCQKVESSHFSQRRPTRSSHFSKASIPDANMCSEASLSMG